MRLHNNDSMWALVVSIFCLGALLGCNASAQLADRWGRKTFLLWNTAIFVLGALLEAASVPHSNPNPNPDPDPNPDPNPNPNPNPNQAASVLPDCPLSGGTLGP